MKRKVGMDLRDYLTSFRPEGAEADGWLFSGKSAGLDALVSN